MKNVFMASTLTLMTSVAFANDEVPLPQTIFANVDIFNGTENKLYENYYVLVEGNKIKTISSSKIKARDDAKVIDGSGKTLTPGFIENHAHLMLMGPSLPAMEAGTTWEDFAIHGTRMAEMYLMQGFTTVRDAGGANGGLRRAIDA
ncbi:amidohydrolase family protein, partial [Vibrio parahaemolyticus]